MIKTRLMVVVFLLLASLSVFQAFRVQTLTNALATSQSALEQRTERLEHVAGAYALKTELGTVKEDLRVLLAQATTVIESNAQANRGALNEMRKRLDEKTKANGTDANALDPAVTEWLRKYDEQRAASLH